jgi:outer membrane protein assembly factor BamB
MSTRPPTATPPPPPECAAVIPLLPLLRAGDLTIAEEQHARGHLATCPYCRDRLASLDALDAGLRRAYDIPAHAQPFLHEADLQAILFAGSVARQPPPLALMHRRRGIGAVRLPAFSAAIAAILLITLGFSLLFHALRGNPIIAATPVRTPSATSAPRIPGPPFVIYYSGADGAAYAVRSTDLSILWHTAPSNGVTLMAFGDGALYLIWPDAAGTELRALGAVSGVPLWSVSLGQTNAPVTSLVAGDGVLAYRDGAALHLLRAADGHQLWQRALQGDGRLVIAAGVIYVADAYSPDGNHHVADLYALRTADGATIWQQRIAPPASDGVVAASDYDYISQDGVVHALALTDGHQVWSFRTTGGAGATATGSPCTLVAAGDALYVETPGDLDALRAASGQHLWQDPLELPPTYAPVAAGERVFLAGHGQFGGSSFIFAVRAADGNELWENHDNYGWIAPPIAVGDTLWGVGSPELAALHADTGVAFAATTPPSAPLLGGPVIAGAP